jgi:hypothetical protein
MMMCLRQLVDEKNLLLLEKDKSQIVTESKQQLVVTGFLQVGISHAMDGSEDDRVKKVISRKKGGLSPSTPPSPLCQSPSSTSSIANLSTRAV